MGQACATAACRANVASGPTFSVGLMVVLDWENADGAGNQYFHAHFGGTDAIESALAQRGLVLMIR